MLGGHFAFLPPCYFSLNAQTFDKSVLEDLRVIQASGLGFHFKPAGHSDGLGYRFVVHAFAEGRHKRIDEDNDLVGLRSESICRRGVRYFVTVLFHPPEVERHGFLCHAQGILVVLALRHTTGQVRKNDSDRAVVIITKKRWEYISVFQ